MSPTVSGGKRGAHATGACLPCPFRKGATFGYDPDALENLDNGYEPSCHEKVGADKIFTIDWPTKTRCRGFDAWSEDKPGFERPKLTKGTA